SGKMRAVLLLLIFMSFILMICIPKELLLSSTNRLNKPKVAAVPPNNSNSYQDNVGIRKSSNMENNAITNAKESPKKLDLDEILMSSSDVTWPVVVMGTGGRTGNCLNTYAVSLALKKEFGGDVTIVVRRRVHDMVAKVMDTHGLTLPVVEEIFTQRA
ncbi:unnamed protein product, partial [Meganyctiphanes norvegica]